jgi:hemoglobin
MTVSSDLTPYQAIGGEAGVRQLVTRFYALMDELPETFALRKMHPQSLSGSAESLFDYLSGWFGGPPLYEAKKGHPRLRMRHAPYAVTALMRDQWMQCMSQAIHEQLPEGALRVGLLASFAQLAQHMINTETPVT